VSLAINYPTLVSVPHSVINAFKNLLAVAVATDIDFKEAQTVRIIVSLTSWCKCIDTKYVHALYAASRKQAVNVDVTSLLSDWM
jgi:hypothetical protein